MTRNRKKTKKLMVILLAFILVFVTSIAPINPDLFGTQKAYAAETVNLNCGLLDSILSDRQWVVDTLVNGDLSSNPTACVEGMNEFICDELLDSYKDNTALKALIHAMDVYANTGQYLSGFANEVIETFMEWFGVSSEEEALERANDLVESLAGLKYESVLNEALKMNYTSSTGRTLHDSQSELEILRQRAEILKKLSPYAKTLQDYLGVVHTEGNLVYVKYDTKDSAYDIDITDYASNVLDAYEQDLSQYLNSVISIPSLEGNSALKEKIVAYSALGMVNLYEQTVATDSSNPYVLSNFEEYFCDDVIQVLEDSGKVLSLSSYVMDNALLLGALNGEKETTVDTLQRLADYSSIEDLNLVLNRYAKLIEDEGNSRILNYENITGYIRNQILITNLVTAKIKSGMMELLRNGSKKISDTGSLLMTHGFAETLCEVGAVVNLSVWISNETTGIKDASKRMVLCEYLNRVITQTANLYKNDVQTYSSNKTEENATRVLNDLELLKILRLYGETLGYQARKIQTTSWLGAIVGDDSTKEYMEQHYQASIDTILSCEASAVKNEPLTINEGETLRVGTETLSNGDTFLCGTLLNGNSEIAKIVEVDNYLMTGIVLNGGNLDITDSTDPIAIPYIECHGTSCFATGVNNIYVGEIYNEGKLSIGLYGNAKNLIVYDSIVNSGNFKFYENEASETSDAQEVQLYCQNLINRSTIETENAFVCVKGNVENNGQVSGKICIQGDDTMYYQNGYFAVSGQSISGSGSISKLYLQNSTEAGTTVDGKQIVDGEFFNNNGKVSGSKDIWLTGNCKLIDEMFGYDLSFQNYTGAQNITLGGDACLYESVTFEGNTNIGGNAGILGDANSITFKKGFSVAGNIEITGDTTILLGTGTPSANAVINKGTTKIEGLDGAQKIILCSDVKNEKTINAPLIRFDASGNVANSGELHGTVNLCTEDSTKEYQLLSGSGTMDSLLINSKADSGIYVAGSQTITKSIQNKETHVANSNDITLTGTCNIIDGYYNGSLSFKDYQTENSFSIKDNGFLSGTVQFGGTTAFGGGLQLTSNLTSLVLGGDCSIDGDLNYDAGTVSGTGWLKLKGDLDMGKSSAIVPFLVMEGKTAQKISGNSFSINRFSNTNESTKGLQLNCTVSVLESLYSSKDANYKSTDSIVLTNNAGVYGATITSPLCSLDWTYIGQQLNAETIKARGTTTIADNKTMTLNNYIQESGTLNVSTDANLICLSSLQTEAVTNAGSILVKGDVVTKGTVSGGKLSIYGDYIASADVNIDDLSLCGSTAQKFSNSAKANVNNLTIKNSSTKGVTISSIINVANEYEKDIKKITGESNIQLAGSSIGTGDKTYKGDVSIADTFTVANGQNAEFEGKLTLKNGANITVNEDGVLTLRRSLKMNGAKITIKSGATLLVNHYLDASNSEIIIEEGGRLILKDDAKFTSTNVSGTGNIALYADLNVSSGTWQDVNLEFVGKIAQAINPNGISCGKITVNNPSKQGVKFTSTLNYSGTLEQGSTAIGGSSNLISCK